jgi:hypothetical protein
MDEPLKNNIMNSKDRLKQALEHKNVDRIPLDLGGTAVSGIHIKIVEELRKHFGLPSKPVKLIEPYQMLGEVDAELLDAMNIDVVGLYGENNMFGFPNKNWKEFSTPWNQEILVPGDFNYSKEEDGSILIYPQGDTSVAATAKMPAKGFFFDALNRQAVIDDSTLNPEDNLEEFNYLSDEDLAHWTSAAHSVQQTGRGVIASFGGTALGDIALVPAMQLKNPKGIRDVSEWYMSLLMRRDYIHKVFEKQVEIALVNLARLKEAVGNIPDAVFICGTDFGTQDSQFCSLEDFQELYAPYYRKVNDWIHENTSWKTFKHSCGAVEPFLQAFIDAGFDIINPVQINAANMDPEQLKKEYGDKLTFWGGGVDTQKMLPFGSPEEVRTQVLQNCELFARGGGFVFNTVHNIQANVPIENVVAMLEAFEEFNA